MLGAVIWEGNLGFAVRAAQEFRFVDLLDTERLRLLELGPRIGADDQRGRPFRQAVGHVAPRGLDQVARLLPRERGQRAGDDKRLVGEGPWARGRRRFLQRQPGPGQAFEQVLVAGVREKADHGLANSGSDPAHLADFLGGSARQRIHRAKMPRLDLRALLPYMAYAEPKEERRERLVLRGGDAVDELLGRLLGEAFQVE